MSGLETNIKFSYLYRDAGNYKVFGSEVFSNNGHLGLKEVKERIENQLIDHEFFEPEKWGVTRLALHPFDPELDHGWHEFEKVEFTGEEVTMAIDISLFLKASHKINVEN